MNIRNKFLWPTILLIVVGLGTSATISYIKSKNALTTALLDNIEQRADTTSTALQSWIRDRQLDLKSWSHEDVYIKATSTSIIGKAARVSANEKLERLFADYGYYEDLILLDTTGAVIAASNADTVGKFNLKDREYFKASMAGNVFASDVSLSRNSGNAVFFISAPVGTKSEVKGVLVGIVSIGNFTKTFIDSIKVGETGYAFVMNQKGMVIAHPDTSMIMKANLGDFDFGKQMLAQKNGLIDYVFEGFQGQRLLRQCKVLNGLLQSASQNPRYWHQ